MDKESIKIEDMSYAQLDALEKLIKAQKKKVGGAFYKGETGVYEALFDEFGDKDEFPGCINVYGNAERCVYYICDLTLGNYKFVETKTGNSVRMNGSVVNTNIDPVAYKDMVNDILKVIKNYHKKGSAPTYKPTNKVSCNKKYEPNYDNAVFNGETEGC